MSKDKLYGAIILVVAIIIAIFYTFMLPVDLWYVQEASGGVLKPEGYEFMIGSWDIANWKWALAIPIYLIVIVICLIAVWIGYSMLTTPPPVPLEELEEELEAEEAKEAKESKEEKKPEEKKA